MSFFRLKPGCGNHSGPGVRQNVKIHKSGELVESEDNLCVLFPNKFELVEKSEDLPKAKKEVSKKSDKKQEAEGDAAPPGLGEDVTQKFDGAKACDFQIYQTEDGKYNIAEKLTPDIAENSEPLSHKQVIKFLSKYEKEE